MGPLFWFCSSVGATVACLIVVVITGVCGKIAVHIPFVAATLLSLAVTIALAIKLGAVYDLKAAGAITPIHKTIAMLATLSYALPLITGIRTLKSREHRRMHFRAAMFVLFMTAAASVTGTLMVLWSPKIVP